MPTLVNTVAATLPENDHPYRNGAWTPNFDEYRFLSLNRLPLSIGMSDIEF